MENNKLIENCTCESCKHFKIHYIKYGKTYSQITDGHCIYPRLKIRKTHTRACEHYKARNNKKEL